MTDSFAADNAEVTPQKETFSEVPSSDKGLELEVNGRKYSNAEAIVKKISAADEHIARLEAERKADRERLAALEAERDKLKGLAEVLARKQQLEQESNTTVIDTEQIARQAANLVKGDLTEEARIAAQRENLANVKRDLTKKYGQSVDDVVRKVIEPLGMTLAEAMDMAKTKPKAFLAYFDKVAAPAPVSTKGGVNTSAINSTPAPAKPRSLIDATTDKERVEIYQERLARKLQASG